MPYIKQSAREELELEGRYPDTAGELNYELTLLIKGYWTRFGGLGYQTINDIVGALEGAKTEFQRRVVNPYEDQKIKENGDLY